jgi:hypothetical protein
MASTPSPPHTNTEAIVIPLASDDEIVADLHTGSLRRLLNKALDAFACMHRWDLVIPSPESWSRWDFVCYRTQAPDLGVFRSRVANRLSCAKCGCGVDVSGWAGDIGRGWSDGVYYGAKLYRQYRWMSKVYFEMMVLGDCNH